MSFPSSVSASTVDLRTLTYLTPTDDNLQCPICHSPLLDPVTTKCRHTFCAACIASSLECSHSCPVDRKPLKPDGVSAAPIMVAGLVNDLLVLCPNSGLGCPTTCARHLLRGHLKEDCQFVAVQCGGCEDTILRRDAAEECLHRIEPCDYCGDNFRLLDMEAHINTCPQILATCPHCELEFTRSTITAHTPICPSAIVPCPASDTGCPYTGPRDTLPTHTPQCAFTLLRPILSAHTARLATLELENRTLRKKIDILLPPRSPPIDQETAYDEQTLQLLTEQEHLRSDIERLSASLGEMEIKQGMLLMNETLRIKEEMAGMRAAINGMRMQMHWLLTVRLQSVGGTQGAAGAAVGGAGVQRRVQGEGEGRVRVEGQGGVGGGAGGGGGDRVKL